MRTAAEHPSRDHLLAYFEAKLDDGGEATVEEHLASCDSCAAEARSVHLFHQLFEAGPEIHQAAMLRSEVGAALEAAAADHPQWTARLEGWRQRVGRLAQAAVQIGLDRFADTADVAAQSVRDLLQPDGWDFEPVPQVVPVRGAPRRAATSSTTLQAAVGSSVAARLAVQMADEGEVVVRIDDLAPDRDLPLVLLIELEGGQAQTVRVAEVELASHADFGVARFDAIPSGRYLLLIEPAGES